jgi:5-formyltetrahydrofolate cyclo-ligase
MACGLESDMRAAMIAPAISHFALLAYVTHTRSPKHTTRRSVLSRRDAMTAEERADASARIADATVTMLLQRVPAGGVVAVYAAKASEVDVQLVDERLRANGIGVAYPRIGGGRQLTFHLVDSMDELVVQTFSIREPIASARIVALQAIAAFVVPCVAFSRDGSRIGWGGGHYDSTLVAAAATALRVGVAFDCQLVDGVPAEAHDIPLHHVITESQVYPV